MFSSESAKPSPSVSSSTPKKLLDPDFPFYKFRQAVTSMDRAKTPNAYQLAGQALSEAGSGLLFDPHYFSLLRGLGEADLFSSPVCEEFSSVMERLEKCKAISERLKIVWDDRTDWRMSTLQPPRGRSLASIPV